MAIHRVASRQCAGRPPAGGAVVCGWLVRQRSSGARAARPQGEHQSVGGPPAGESVGRRRPTAGAASRVSITLGAQSCPAQR